MRSVLNIVIGALAAKRTTAEPPAPGQTISGLSRTTSTTTSGGATCGVGQLTETSAPPLHERASPAPFDFEGVIRVIRDPGFASCEPNDRVRRALKALGDQNFGPVASSFAEKIEVSIDMRTLLGESDRAAVVRLEEQHARISRTIRRIGTARTKELFMEQRSEIQRLADAGEVETVFTKPTLTYEQFAQFRDTKMRDLKARRRQFAPLVTDLATRALVEFAERVGALAIEENRRQSAWCAEWGLPYRPSVVEISLAAILMMRIREIPWTASPVAPSGVPILAPIIAAAANASRS